MMNDWDWEDSVPDVVTCFGKAFWGRIAYRRMIAGRKACIGLFDIDERGDEFYVGVINEENQPSSLDFKWFDDLRAQEQVFLTRDTSCGFYDAENGEELVFQNFTGDQFESAKAALQELKKRKITTATGLQMQRFELREREDRIAKIPEPCKTFEMVLGEYASFNRPDAATTEPPEALETAETLISMKSAEEAEKRSSVPTFCGRSVDRLEGQTVSYEGFELKVMTVRSDHMSLEELEDLLDDGIGNWRGVGVKPWLQRLWILKLKRIQ